MSEKIVALGRVKNDPDPRIIKELERYLNLAKEGRIKTLLLTAEVPDLNDSREDEIQTRWFEAQKDTIDYIRILGMAGNIQHAVGQRLYEMGWEPDEDEDG